MAANVTVCNLDPDLEKQLEKFRFRRDTSNHAIVMKVDRESHTVVCDELLEDLENIEELRDALPEHQPRLVVYANLEDHKYRPNTCQGLQARDEHDVCRLQTCPGQ